MSPKLLSPCTARQELIHKSAARKAGTPSVLSSQTRTWSLRRRYRLAMFLIPPAGDVGGKFQVSEAKKLKFIL